MLTLRPLAAGAALAAAASLLPSIASAQTPPPATTEDDPIRLTIDAHVGVTYRLGEIENVDSRGGGLFGLNALVGPVPWLALGAGYERSFLGRDKGPEDTPATLFGRIGRPMDALWFLGRAYPYQDEDFALFVQLAGGPIWQGVDSDSVSLDQRTGTSSACSGSDSADFGMRAGIGAELPLTSLLIFTADVGVDHLRLSDAVIDQCAKGAGTTTMLAGRLGFALATGREKAAPPPPPPAPPPDTDRDGIADLYDACPAVPGVANADPKKHGCPAPTDRDGDGIFDEQDACPDVVGVPNADPVKNGCPPSDRDGDTIIDDKDACPDLAGVASDDPAQNGCPPDTDGDTIRDDKDACPKEKGIPNEDPAKHGCPLVQFTETEIVISQEVQFDTDKATIKKESDGLLDEVANVIKQHPEIVKMEVQGHTDSTGSKFRNKTLSQQRAESVRKALEARGVGKKTMVAKGYGSDVPIGDNETEAGKKKNRRVQFKITEKK